MLPGSDNTVGVRTLPASGVGICDSRIARCFFCSVMVDVANGRDQCTSHNAKCTILGEELLCQRVSDIARPEPQFIKLALQKDP